MGDQPDPAPRARRATSRYGSTTESLLDLLDPEAEPPDASALFERLAKEAADVPGFSVAARVVLANFCYAKLPMVNDLAAG